MLNVKIYICLVKYFFTISNIQLNVTIIYKKSIQLQIIIISITLIKTLYIDINTHK